MTTYPPRLTYPMLRVLRMMLDAEALNRILSGAQMMKASGLSSGTLYPVLHRLEGAGWVNSKWEDAHQSELGRPRCRMYELTKQGRSEANKVFTELLPAE